MTSTVRRTVAAIGGAVAVVAAASWLLHIRSAIAPRNVVIITLDTTRVDRLSPYGFADIKSPALERLARDGVVFDQAISVAPLTLTAHTSLFTGLIPPHHGVRDNADAALDDTHPLLAEYLQQRGFRTGAFVGSVVLDPDRGLRRGFDRYSGVTPHADSPKSAHRRPANEVVDDAIGWLDGVGGSPFFLWAHLYDAHRPWSPSEPYRSMYAHDPYLGAIAFADSQVGRLVDALDQRHLLERTLLIVVADHGESLGAHGEEDHGIFVYDDTLRVPLIVRGPGLGPARIGETVRLTDLMPTVLDALGVPAPQTDGVSLVALMRGRRHDLDLEAYSESLYPERFGWSPLRALRSGRLKLIDAPRPELYDLDLDPFETHNVYDARPGETRILTTRLAGIARGRESPASDGRTETAARLRTQLASLGYISSVIRRPDAGNALLPDPKDCIGVLGDPMAPPASVPATCRSVR